MLSRDQTVVDLRSDTVTKPTAAMRRAMSEAEVGDDVLGDDPTVIRLQERIAAIMGKEAAVFVPSGTMANQAAIRAQTEPGDEVLAHEGSHIIHYETGAPAALSGVMVRPLPGARGMFDAKDVDESVRPYSAHFARSRLLVIENTHNRGGGSVWARDRLERVAKAGRAHGLRLHLDGARIWNASVKTGIAPCEYAATFDTVSCCFSKGLGAPAGSAVCGDRETIFRVHRFRKMFGGAMRQAGVLAAAAMHALDNHIPRLAEDHDNASELAKGLAAIDGVKVDLEGVETNMVFFDVVTAWGTAAQMCKRLEGMGVRVLPTGPQRVRAVCHMDVDRAGVLLAVEKVAAAMRGTPVAG